MLTGEADTCRTVLTALDNFCVMPSSCGKVIPQQIKTFTLNAHLIYVWFHMPKLCSRKIVNFLNNLIHEFRMLK